MMDGKEMFGHDVKAGAGQQMMDVGDAPVQGIFHRDDGKIGFAFAHRFDRVLESGTGNGLRLRQRFARGEIAEGARFTLEGDAFGRCDDPAHAIAAKRARALSRSSGVSTLSGTSATRATAIVMPASSARSCSSFSRFSSGDGGSATKRASALRVYA